MTVYDLTTPIEGQPSATLYRSDATHEMLLYALNPDHNSEYRVGKLLPSNDAGAFYTSKCLQPANYGYQWCAKDNNEAEQLCSNIVTDVSGRSLSPDTDYRATWDRLHDWYPLVKTGWAGNAN